LKGQIADREAEMDGLRGQISAKETEIASLNDQLMENYGINCL
jgi:cell division protein FtsB